MKTVFVDTSGFYALLDGTDPYHGRARQAFVQARADAWRLVTSSYVLHESWALIQARLGWDAVDGWRDKIVPLCDVVWVDKSLHALGEARCRQARERRLSLTDCVSFEVMRQAGIREYIGQDDHFRRAGFQAL
ncbi:MAG: type II toxin-antitoxin system VapC family toxin [Planctomycetes bacterium]|nr:type II toxin-antitoxin system VapC family toxin [Planctomycetota bacterium]